MEKSEKKLSIDVTPAAIENIKKQLEKRKTPNAYIRLGVKGSGCVGFSYSIEFDDNGPKNKDILFNFDGANILVDKKSILYLNGLQLDWLKETMKEGFVFNNPNEQSRCGCGKSFTAKV